MTPANASAPDEVPRWRNNTEVALSETGSGFAESTQIARRGPRRWWAFGRLALREASVGLWRSVSFVAGAGIVTAISAVIAGGAAAAAIFNIAWIFFAAFLILFFLALLGGYRVWSPTERDLGAAKEEVDDLKGRPTHTFNVMQADHGAHSNVVEVGSMSFGPAPAPAVTRDPALLPQIDDAELAEICIGVAREIHDFLAERPEPSPAGASDFIGAYDRHRQELVTEFGKRFTGKPLGLLGELVDRSALSEEQVWPLLGRGGVSAHDIPKLAELLGIGAHRLQGWKK